MEMGSSFVRFRLPVSWDIATRVLKHTARNGRTRFDIQRHGNGFLRLQLARAVRPTITIDVMSLAELDSATTVLAVDVTRGLRLTKRESHVVGTLLERFQSDAEFFATRLSGLDGKVMHVQGRQPVSLTRRLFQVRERSLDWREPGIALDSPTEAT